MCSWRIGNGLVRWIPSLVACFQISLHRISMTQISWRKSSKNIAGFFSFLSFFPFLDSFPLFLERIVSNSSKTRKKTVRMPLSFVVDLLAQMYQISCLINDSLEFLMFLMFVFFFFLFFFFLHFCHFCHFTFFPIVHSFFLSFFSFYFPYSTLLTKDRWTLCKSSLDWCSRSGKDHLDSNLQWSKNSNLWGQTQKRWFVLHYWGRTASIPIWFSYVLWYDLRRKRSLLWWRWSTNSVCFFSFFFFFPSFPFFLTVKTNLNRN